MLIASADASCFQQVPAPVLSSITRAPSDLALPPLESFTKGGGGRSSPTMFFPSTAPDGWMRSRSAMVLTAQTAQTVQEGRQETKSNQGYLPYPGSTSHFALEPKCHFGRASSFENNCTSPHLPNLKVT